MKEAGTAHWSSPNNGATNESGFSALPGGGRDGNGEYRKLGFGAFFCSTTRPSTRYISYSRELDYFSSAIDRIAINEDRGYSVRCVMD